MISFADYLKLNEGLSAIERARILDNIVKRVRGKVVTQNFKVLDKIELAPGDMCWYVSIQGNRFAIYNIDGTMRVVRKGDKETKPSPEMLNAVKLRK